MEDAHITRLKLKEGDPDNINNSFFAVFDGHSGKPSKLKSQRSVDAYRMQASS
jgi:serine/threonine protein phosphatase PrpC